VLVEGTDKDQWLAGWSAWLGSTLDAFDFTLFLLIMVERNRNLTCRSQR